MGNLPTAKALLLAVVAAFLAAPAAHAQDAARVDPAHFHVLLEKDCVRVLRAQFGPREKSVMYSHPDTLVIFLTDGEVLFDLPTGGAEDLHRKAGQAAWEPAGRTMAENPTHQPWELILVELKGESHQLQIPAVPKRTRVRGDIQKANLVHYVPPVYPPIAKAAGVEGTVVLRAILRTDGGIQQLRYVSGSPLLVQAAMEAVRQWRYRPTLLNGEPVEVETTISVVFKLP